MDTRNGTALQSKSIKIGAHIGNYGPISHISQRYKVSSLIVNAIEYNVPLHLALYTTTPSVSYSQGKD